MRIFLLILFISIFLRSEEIINTDNDIDENEVLINDTTILTHKQNYILFFSYDLEDHQEYRDNKETSFQLSLKKMLVYSIFNYDIKVYAAYTQKSFWQVYDDKHSRPFRETNYNPELFISSVLSDDIQKYHLTNLDFGYEHESNGQYVYSSRSWNRLYAKLFFEKDDIKGSLKLWGRLNENKKKHPLDPKGDDNHDITDYYGYSELSLFYNYHDHEIGLFLRKKALEAELSLPFAANLYLIAKYFNGYGESLIDYNERVEKFSFGILLNR